MSDAGDDPNASDELVFWAQTTVWPLIERSPRVVKWCPRWWEHPEALFRMTLIRDAWELAVTSDDNPQALSDWMLHVVDPHVNVLLSSTGPFADCPWTERDGHKKKPHQPKPLPQEWPEDFDYDHFPSVSQPQPAQQAS